MLKHSDILFHVVHCSATKDGVDIGAKDINEWHIQRGWHDRPGIKNLKFRGRPHAIAYNNVIRIDGAIEVGCPMGIPGYHAVGFNRKAWSVCLIGGLDKDGKPANTYTQDQMDSLAMVLRSWRVLTPKAKVLGHRDLSPDINGDGVIQSYEWVKACPCFDVIPWWKSVRSGT